MVGVEPRGVDAKFVVLGGVFVWVGVCGWWYWWWWECILRYRS